MNHRNGNSKEKERRAGAGTHNIGLQKSGEMHKNDYEIILRDLSDADASVTA